MPFHACQARNRAAEPDFEIGRERKCLRSRGQRRKTSFSRSRSRGGPAQGPRTAANRTGSSNPALFFCDIKDLLAVQGVSSEPVSPEFPVKQGKNREFSQICPRIADSYGLTS